MSQPYWPSWYSLIKRHDGSNSGSMKCSATNRMKNTAVAPNETLEAVSENAVSGFVVMLIFGILRLSSSLFPLAATPLDCQASVMSRRLHSAKPSNHFSQARLAHSDGRFRSNTSISPQHHESDLQIR